MVVTDHVANAEEVVDCREDDGALRDSMRANNKKLTWEEICYEMIDNALEHSGDVCEVSFEWGTQKEELFFSVIDHGRGSNDIRAFFKPGKSVGTGKRSGNSTFGMGLFVCECCISFPETFSLMQVATSAGDGTLLIGRRVIDNASTVKVVSQRSSRASLSKYGLDEHGTNVQFSRFTKRLPKGDEYARISKNIGEKYATSIIAGELTVILKHGGVTSVVEPEQPPVVAELKTQKLLIDEHEFVVEWGVTNDYCRDNGCRMIYGGKFFDATDAPCGSYNIGRFYASIRIPRTIGRESMDILKRCVDHPCIDELLDRCADLFRPELAESDRICRHGDDESLNKDISDLLSIAIKPLDGAGDMDGDEPNKRTFKGRDKNRKGVIPTETGPKHKRRKKTRVLPDTCSVLWSRLGEDKGLAVYQYESNRITFNEDAQMMLKLRDEKHKMLLASIAAGHIAKDIEGSPNQIEFGFGDNDFVWIYRVMMERVAASCEV